MHPVQKSASNPGEDIPTSENRVPILGEEIPTPEKYPPNLGQEIPTSGNYASVLGQDNPTLGKHASDLGHNIPTAENYPSDLGQIIPTSEYLLPVLRQVFQTKKCSVSDSEHIIPASGWFTLGGTSALYCQYKGSVLAVQKPCTAGTAVLYDDKNHKLLYISY